MTFDPLLCCFPLIKVVVGAIEANHALRDSRCQPPQQIVTSAMQIDRSMNFISIEHQ